MAFKPNYNHERAERQRAKARKKAEKQAKRREGDVSDSPASDELVVGESVSDESGPGDGANETPGATGSETQNDGGQHGA